MNMQIIGFATSRRKSNWGCPPSAYPKRGSHGRVHRLHTQSVGLMALFAVCIPKAWVSWPRPLSAYPKRGSHGRVHQLHTQSVGIMALFAVCIPNAWILRVPTRKNQSGKNQRQRYQSQKYQDQKHQSMISPTTGWIVTENVFFEEIF